MSYSLTFAPASGHTLYLDVAAGVTAAVLTGRYLEARAKRQSGSALTALAGLAARTVAVLRDGGEQRVPVAELAAGDRFVVRPGEKIAADGVVVEGRSAVDASLVTGESMPAEVGPGDEVIGSCVSMSGRLVVRATRVGDGHAAGPDHPAGQPGADEQGGGAAPGRPDRRDLRPVGDQLAVATLGFWLGAGLPGDAAWSAAIAVLVVACPCALGLATPTALLAGVGRGAQLGILVKGVHALESAQRIRTVVLDKTGTLTRGTMTVLDIVTAPVAGAASGADETDVLLLAGAVEDASEHPIGQAIAREAAARLGGLPPVTGFTACPGPGSAGPWLATQSPSGARGSWPSRGWPPGPPCRPRWPRPRVPGARPCWPAGTAVPRVCWSSPTCCGRARGRGGPAAAAGPAAGPAHRGQRADRPGGRGPAGHPGGQRDRGGPAGREGGCRPPAPGRWRPGRDGRRRRQRRGRAGPGRPGHGHRHRDRRRDRGRRPDPGQR